MSYHLRYHGITSNILNKYRSKSSQHNIKYVWNSFNLQLCFRTHVSALGQLSTFSRSQDLKGGWDASQSTPVRWIKRTSSKKLVVFSVKYFLVSFKMSLAFSRVQDLKGGWDASQSTPVRWIKCPSSKKLVVCSVQFFSISFRMRLAFSRLLDEI